MNGTIQKIIRIAALLAMTLTLGTTGYAQTATWNNIAADNDWNNAGNWDIGVPAEGTNAIIGAGFTVNYAAPMVAGSFNGMTANSPVNVSAAGFTSSATWTISGAAAKFNVNSGGVAAVTNGNLTFTANGGGALASGGSLSLQSQLNMGASGAGNNGFFTNNGGTLSAATTRINPNNLSSSSVLIINGGTNNLGATSLNRSAASSFQGIGAEGLVISNGLVNLTSLSVGGLGANSHLSAVLVNGTVTNTGSFIINQITSGRAARFLQMSGLFVSTDPIGARVAITNAGSIGIYSVTGGTNFVERFVLGDLTNNSGTVNLTNAAKIYIGSGGMVSNLIQTVNVALNNGGTFGANADWTGGVSIILAGGSFDCGDLAGTAHNITLANVVRSSGALTKNGGGTLTLTAANTYSGNTAINTGTLALGATGTIANSPQIIVASGATFDVSAVSGYTLGGTRILAGSGTVTGDVAVASGGIVSPGTSPGTLTLANSLIETGGAINHFDLPTTPGPGNDLLIVNGDLNVTNVNTLEIVGGGSPGTVHTLIQYGGNFNGTLPNFSISGATGSLSNNPTTKTISLIVAAAIRNPTNVVWLGGLGGDIWDTVGASNWLNGVTRDYFVTGDNARFDDTGATNPIVMLVGNNAAGSVTMDTSSNYTFTGSGAISGSGSLTKTNSGTLTITATNSYSGVTTIAGGALEAGSLANGGSVSAIGSASSDPNNLVFYGGTLRYLGDSVATDRGATLNAGATIDVATSTTTLTANGIINGTGALTKAGTGTLTLAVANGYSGGTIINNGTLQMNTATSAGTAGITNNNGTTQRINGALTVDNVQDFNGNVTLDLANAGGNTAVRGAWTGSGTVTIINQQNSSRTFTIGGGGAGGGHMWDFSGSVDFGVNAGSFRINNDNSNFNFGSSNATFNVGTSTGALNQRNGGTTTHFGALIGGPSTSLAGRGGTGASGTTTYSIGGKNIDCTFQGGINNGSGTTAITKVGTGKLTLTGTGTHTGATVVESGTLQIDGSYGSSAVTVVGGTLAGNGTLGGSVDIQANGVLSPGASIGRLTMTSSLTLQPGSTNVMELNKSASTNDSIVGLSSVAYGGTLVVANLAGTLADGDTFKLFDSTSYSGAFDFIELPALGANLFWDTSNLVADGTIRIFTPRPSITSLGVDGSNFFLTGTNGGNTSTHFIVLTTTAVNTPLAGWTPVLTNTFDGSGNFAFTNVLNTAEPARFYTVKTP